MNHELFWKAGIKGDGVIVAVIDHGFNLQHEEIADKIIEDRSFDWEDKDDPTSVTDISGHGTACASIVSGSTVGIAPNAGLLLLKANNIGPMVSAIRYATDWEGPNGEKVAIISMSVGTKAGLLSIRDAVRAAADRGILIVAAAGNGGDGDEDTDEIVHPAAYSEVVCVGAYKTSPNGEVDGIQRYSNSNREVDLVGPGNNVLAARHTGGTRLFSGTSSAAPYVAGCAVLLRQAFSWRRLREPSLGELFQEVIRNTTMEGLEELDSRLTGAGRIFLTLTKGAGYVFEGYRVTSEYGVRIDPIDKTERFHSGIDLVKGFREPIYAFTAGEVVHSGTGISGSGLGGYGEVVAIRDAYGALHCYCHLDTCLVKVGAKVEEGQTIGREGATGRVTGPHLHYEVRKASSPKYGWIGDTANMAYDPRAYLASYYEKSRAKAKLTQFKDVPAGHWAESFIAAAKGIMDGYPDGTFKPDQPITRAEVAAIVHRLKQQ